jgi:superoxide dismutase, Fe-Mn family
MMNRRNAIKLAALATVAITSNTRAADPAPAVAPAPVAGNPPPVISRDYKVAELPYAFNALEPFIDEETMKLHHNFHHQSYANNLGIAIGKHMELNHKPAEEMLRHLDQVPEDIRTQVRNHGGGYVNHNIFWKCLTPNALREPIGPFNTALGKQFNLFSGFKEKFSKAALEVFGSGWTWLTMDAEKNLRIESTFNQDSPLSQGRLPLLGIDVWEHAYYLKYHNRRAEYINAFFHVINWKYVVERYEKGTLES